MATRPDSDRSRAGGRTQSPRSAVDRADPPEPHVPDDQLRPGDLVFYGTPDNVHHVGLYIGGGQMINAPGQERGHPPHRAIPA
ncbi:NlpC/P60 family protein [Streptomyces sp. 8N114]|uniref:NlpC/P60 family protein n=1 Tax=Streptomyces sp. 8N114 TaxID=3457419 RepID=UPI003FCF12B1